MGRAPEGAGRGAPAAERVLTEIRGVDRVGETARAADRGVTRDIRWIVMVLAGVTQQSQLMKAELQRIMDHGSLSKDVYEVVSKSLV